MAGGTGKRMGSSVPKQLIPLNGVPILVHTVQRFFNYRSDIFIGLALHPQVAPIWEALAIEHFSEKERSQMVICPGGAERTDSVCNGLQTLADHAAAHGWEHALVAIHDGVRPFVSNEMLEAAYRTAQHKGSAVVSVPVKSSMRKKAGTGSIAIDRSEYFHVQTPQVFHLEKILSLYLDRPATPFTDDASLAEAMGMEIHLSEGSYNNIKITTQEDLVIAERLLNAKSE